VFDHRLIAARRRNAAGMPAERKTRVFFICTKGGGVEQDHRRAKILKNGYLETSECSS
jgi:hypothetical protein